MAQRLRLAPVLLVGFLMGCAPGPAPITINFPSQDVFLRSSTGQLMLFALPANQAGACARIELAVLHGTSTNATPVYDSGAQPICQFRDGNFNTKSIAHGLVAYIFVAAEAGDQALAAGCAVQDVYSGAMKVTVPLQLTTYYTTNYGPGAPPPACSSIQKKCGNGC